MALPSAIRLERMDMPGEWWHFPPDGTQQKFLIDYAGIDTEFALIEQFENRINVTGAHYRLFSLFGWALVFIWNQGVSA